MSITTLLEAIDELKRVVNATPQGGASNNAAAVEKVIERFDDLFRERNRFGGVRRILVAVDDSDQARWALSVATGLAEGLGASIMLAHVVTPVTELAPEFAYQLEDERAAALAAGDRLVDQFAAMIPTPVEVQKIRREGHPAAEIVSASIIFDADLIVMGTHGRGRVGHFLMGSTAASVVREALCPVLVVAHDPGCEVRPPARSTGEPEKAALARSGD